MLRFPPPIKTCHHNITEILLKVALNTITLILTPYLIMSLIQTTCLCMSTCVQICIYMYILNDLQYNWTFFSLISSSDVVRINELTVILKINSTYIITRFTSTARLTLHDTTNCIYVPSDKVCLDLQNCQYFICKKHCTCQR